jgi:hypothetical protein
VRPEASHRIEENIQTVRDGTGAGEEEKRVTARPRGLP